MTSDRRTVDRRRVLGTIGIGATAAIAGCLGDEGENGDDEEENGDDEEENGEEPELTEPVDFPEDDDEGECAVCNMIAVEYPDWNAQVVHEDGHREYFCSKGCLVAYYFAPEKFTGGDPDEEIVGVWATSFDSGDLIDVTEGYFVYERDTDRHDYPMPRGSPPAFEDEESALDYVEEYDDLSEDDVFTLEDIDREMAEFYREPRLEEMA